MKEIFLITNDGRLPYWILKSDFQNATFRHQGGFTEALRHLVATRSVTCKAVVPC